MPRKGKLKRAKPTPARGRSVNKYGRWRNSVLDLLTAQWPSSDDLESVAATVVGMFDAGATDAEVAAFLRAHELSEESGVALTDTARLALVRELHKSAALEAT